MVIDKASVHTYIQHILGEMSHFKWTHTHTRTYSHSYISGQMKASLKRVNIHFWIIFFVILIDTVSYETMTWGKREKNTHTISRALHLAHMRISISIKLSWESFSFVYVFIFRQFSQCLIAIQYTFTILKHVNVFIND